MFHVLNVKFVRREIKRTLLHSPDWSFMKNQGSVLHFHLTKATTMQGYIQHITSQVQMSCSRMTQHSARRSWVLNQQPSDYKSTKLTTPKIDSDSYRGRFIQCNSKQTIPEVITITNIIKDGTVTFKCVIILINLLQFRQETCIGLYHRGQTI